MYFIVYLTTITKHYKTSQVLKILIITNFVGSRLIRMKGQLLEKGKNKEAMIMTMIIAKGKKGKGGKGEEKGGKLEEFCIVLCENCGGWRWSILSRFWRILGVLVFGASVFLSMSIWNGFGISGVMEFQ